MIIKILMIMIREQNNTDITTETKIKIIMIMITLKKNIRIETSKKRTTYLIFLRINSKIKNFRNMTKRKIKMKDNHRKL